MLLVEIQFNFEMTPALLVQPSISVCRAVWETNTEMLDQATRVLFEALKTALISRKVPLISAVTSHRDTAPHSTRSSRSRGGNRAGYPAPGCRLAPPIYTAEAGRSSARSAGGGRSHRIGLWLALAAGVAGSGLSRGFGNSAFASKVNSAFLPVPPVAGPTHGSNSGQAWRQDRSRRASV